jgi:hypothetical protein
MYFTGVSSKTLKVKTNERGEFRLRNYGYSLKIIVDPLNEYEIVRYTPNSFDARDLLKSNRPVRFMLRKKRDSLGTTLVGGESKLTNDGTGYTTTIPITASNGLIVQVALSPSNAVITPKPHQLDFRISGYNDTTVKLMPNIPLIRHETLGASSLKFVFSNSLPEGSIKLPFQVFGTFGTNRYECDFHFDMGGHILWEILVPRPPPQLQFE